MLQTILVFAWGILFWSGTLFASPHFCQTHTASDFSNQAALQDENRLWFRNPAAGIGNGGLCWWHSQFQRNALFLADFDATAAPPSSREARKIIRQLIDAKAVVKVPGFQNLRDFSRVYEKEITKALEDWQMSQGVVNGGWVDGVQGSHEVEAPLLKQGMDELYRTFQIEKAPIFQVLQMPGVVAHAWLVIDMKTLNRPGHYLLTVLDSNELEPAQYEYIPGMRSFLYRGKTPFVPYTSRQKELRRLKETVSNYCQ